MGPSAVNTGLGPACTATSPAKVSQSEAHSQPGMRWGVHAPCPRRDAVPERSLLGAPTRAVP